MEKDLLFLLLYKEENFKQKNNSDKKMKAIFGSWERHVDNNIYTFDNVGSGYENIAACLDGRWHVLSEKTKEKFDLVLCCSPDGKNNISKPASWGKLVLIQESGFGVLNTHWYYEKLFDINFDAFLVHSKRLIPLFQSLNRPVVEFCPPYPFAKVASFSKPVVPNKVCLNMNRLLTFESNIAANIRLCQLLPDLQFISYSGDHANLSKILQKSKIDNWQSKPDVTWLDYVKEVGDCAIFASLDNRHTWGRFQLDAAALGKICVGAYSETQNIFYPKDYCVDATEVEKLADLIKSNIGKTFHPDPLAVDKVSHQYFCNKLIENFL
jgi:hypothetical protein